MPDGSVGVSQEPHAVHEMLAGQPRLVSYDGRRKYDTQPPRRLAGTG